MLRVLRAVETLQFPVARGSLGRMDHGVCCPLFAKQQDHGGKRRAARRIVASVRSRRAIAGPARRRRSSATLCAREGQGRKMRAAVTP